MIVMTDNVEEVVTPDVDLEQEVSGTEDEQEQAELDYEAEFNATYGDDPTPTPEVEPIVEEEQEEEQLEEELGEEEEQKEAPDPEPETPAVPDPSDPYSWIDGLPDDVKAQAEALKHAAESDKGRVSAYNRRLSALQYEVDRMKARPDLTAEQTEQGNLDESAAAPELPEKYQQLKEDFPEFADAVDAIRKHDRSEFDKMVADRLQPIEDERTTRARQDFDSEVTSGAAEIFDTTNTGVDWHDIVTSNNFTSWLSQQPASVQRAASIRDSSEALNVLRRYEDDYQRSVTATNDVKAEKTQKEQTTKADKIQQNRNQRQKAGVAPGSKSAPSAGGEGGGDYEAEFNATWG